MTSRIRLGSRAYKHYRSVSVSMAGVIALLCAAFTIVALSYSSAQQAVRDSVSTSFGNTTTILQVREPDVALPVLSKLPDLIPVVEGEGLASANERTEVVATRTSPLDGINLDALIDGNFPTHRNEVSVSLPVADSLGLSVGDSLRLDAEGDSVEKTVVGVIVDPVRADQKSVNLVQGSIPPATTTFWASLTNSFSDRDVNALFDAEAVTGRTVDILAQDESSVLSERSFGPIRVALVIIVTTTFWIVLCFVPGMNKRTKPARNGLIAAGMGAAKADRLLIKWFCFILFFGGIVGCLIGVATTLLLRRWIAPLLNQYWLSVSPSIFPVMLLVVLVLLGAIAAKLNLKYEHGRKPSFALPSEKVFVVSALVSLAVAAGITPFALNQRINLQFFLIAYLVAAVATPILCALVIKATERHVVVRRVLTKAGAGMLMVSFLVSGLTALASGYSARGVHTDRASEATGGVAQPVGSLAIYQAPLGAIEKLGSTYTDLGGEQYKDWVLPNETTTYLRVTSPELLDCMEENRLVDIFEAEATCGSQLQGGVAPINLVVIDPEAREDVVASTDAITDGKIAIVQFNDVTGEVDRTDRQDGVVVDKILGGNLPGAALSAQGEVAKKYQVKASSSGMAVFLDFADMDAVDQAKFRTEVIRLAGAAQIAEEEIGARGRSTRAAVVVSVSAAAAISVILLVAGRLLWPNFLPLARMTALTGVSKRKRYALLCQHFAPLLFSGLGGGAWGLAAAMVITGGYDSLGYGWVWVLPPVAAFFSGLFVLWGWSRRMVRVFSGRASE